MSDDQKILTHAIELAIANKMKGARPFAAVIVKDHEIIATGVNNMLPFPLIIRVRSSMTN